MAVDESVRPKMELGEVMLQCLRHFVHLDESNAAVHCSPVRYSPITFRLAEHLDLYSSVTDPFVAAVMAHVGQYAEDTGR